MMNCHKVKKYLFAFADGQLSVQLNCEVLDHLKMCPACSSVVDEHQAVRRTIAKSAERTRMPAGLEARIRHAIETDGLAKPAKKAAASARTFRFTRVAALAACIVIALTLVWPHFFGETFSPVDTLTAGGLPGLSDADQITQLAVRRHNKCKLKCDLDSHQNPALSRDLGVLASEIDGHFGNAIASAAPDLTGFGFEFESANFCNPTTEQDAPSAHVMYVNFSNSSRLSLFSVRHWKALDDASGNAPDRNSPFMNAATGCDNNSMLAWNEGDMTYIIVGQLDVDRMKEMVDGIKLADAPLLEPAFASGILADAMGH